MQINVLGTICLKAERPTVKLVSLCYTFLLCIGVLQQKHEHSLEECNQTRNADGLHPEGAWGGVLPMKDFPERLLAFLGFRFIRFFKLRYMKGKRKLSFIYLKGP